MIEVFVKMRELLSTNKEILQKLEPLEKKDFEQDEKIMLILEYLKQLEKVKQEQLEFKNPAPVGCKQIKRRINIETFP